MKKALLDLMLAKVVVVVVVVAIIKAISEGGFLLKILKRLKSCATCKCPLSEGGIAFFLGRSPLP